jgi:hypothetical protein
VIGRKKEDDESAYERNVKFPVWVNTILGVFMKLDIFLIRLGISLPFGGTLVVVASK